MRKSVLLSVETHRSLVRSAQDFLEKKSIRTIENVPQLKGVELDPGFPAVPIGRGQREIGERDLLPGSSDRFLVRAMIDVESMFQVPVEINGAAVYADPVITSFKPHPITCLSSPAQGTYADVQTALDTAALAAKGLDGTDVAIAIVDSGIDTAHVDAKLGFPARFDTANFWSPPPAYSPIGKDDGHGTMSAFDALIAAPNASLLDFPVLSAPLTGGSEMSGTLAAAVVAYIDLMIGWSVLFAPGGIWQYKALVVSNSWGCYHTDDDFPAGHPGRYCDNPEHAFQIAVSNLVAKGVDVVFGAGNWWDPLESTCRHASLSIL